MDYSFYICIYNNEKTRRKPVLFEISRRLQICGGGEYAFREIDCNEEFLFIISIWLASMKNVDCQIDLFFGLLLPTYVQAADIADNWTMKFAACSHAAVDFSRSLVWHHLFSCFALKYVLMIYYRRWESKKVSYKLRCRPAQEKCEWIQLARWAVSTFYSLHWAGKRAVPSTSTVRW